MHCTPNWKQCREWEGCSGLKGQTTTISQIKCKNVVRKCKQITACKNAWLFTLPDIDWWDANFQSCAFTWITCHPVSFLGQQIPYFYINAQKKVEDKHIYFQFYCKLFTVVCCEEVLPLSSKIRYLDYFMCPCFGFFWFFFCLGLVLVFCCCSLIWDSIKFTSLLTGNLGCFSFVNGISHPSFSSGLC